jgi:NADP-dependent 3-hydroxy acid dehydrogenase YdfG
MLKRVLLLGLVGRRLDRLKKIKAKIHVLCEIYTVDVSDQKSLQKAASHFIKKYGAPDIVIANAGGKHRHACG